MVTRQLSNHGAKAKVQQATNQLTFIVGPTATGKTSLAFAVAQKMSADILSADSRQIYQGLEITSGLDLPDDWIVSNEQIDNKKYFSKHDTNLYGLNILSLDEEWSIAHFRNFAEIIWEQTQKRGKSLIIVGGSGLYHHSLFLEKETLNIGPSADLREKLEGAPVEKLQKILTEQYPQASEILNNSDWQNPRRLIRWIEKTAPSVSTSPEHPSIFGKETDHHWIGLTADKETLEEKIRLRVDQRIQTGAIQEVEKVLSLDDAQKLHCFSTLGVKDIALYITNQISKEELVQLWTKHELQYAKRQMTWFKKRTYIQWFDTALNTTEQLLEQIK